MSKLKIGLHISDDEVLGKNDKVERVTDNGALIDFEVSHIEGRNYTAEDAAKFAERLRTRFDENGVDFIVNCEYQNWNENCTAPDGTEWSYDGDGCHRLQLPDDFMSALCKSAGFKGIMFDEFEHILMNRNPTIQINTKLRKIIPVFPLLKTKDALRQGEYLTGQLREYADSFKAQGAPAFYGEHVYPVMFHKFAESGITPNYKSLKENISDVAFAMAAGAALQYGLPLYNCIDSWYMLTNPGHSAEEMYYNLLFAFLAGVDCAYVESIHVMTDGDKLTAHGEEFKRFCREYKDKDRGYSIKDYRPEIGIVHYDDGFWGQWYPVLFKKCLFGNPKIKPDFRSYEIFRIFNILTHGETCKNGFSFGRFSLWSLLNFKHFSFVSLNSTAVFDHNADRKVLDSLKLCFLCGIHISENTLKQVRRCVRENGMTAVAPKRFAPADIVSQASGKISEVNDGKGKWIVIKSYRTGKLKNYVKKYIGKKGEMRLTFAGEEIIMKINKDKDSFTVID